jgi:hypothetical protein
MNSLTEMLTILNLCSVQFFGIFDSNTSLYQSSVPAVILCKEIPSKSQKTLETLKSIQLASLSQKCLKSGTGIIAFISVNDQIVVEPFQNEFTLNRYTPLLEQISTYSNPAFVLLQIKATINKQNFIFDWMKLQLTSQLLLFDAETLYRPTIDPGPSLKISFDNRTAIQSILSTSCTKLNLNGRYIHLTAGIPRGQKISDCSLNLDKLFTHPELCVLHFLEKQINFTTKPYRKRPKYFFLKLFNILADNHANNVIISKGIPGLHWLTHGVNFEPYKLILISKLQRVNVDSLLQPFDRNMWMALILANCLFFIVVCVGSKFKEKRKLVLWMISTILSQTDEMLTKYLFDKKRLINFALVSSWVFSMFLLNVLYQGDLYSYLSNARIPSLPNSLREILETKIPLFTIGESCHYSETVHDSRLCSSTLRNVLIPDILKNKEAQPILRKVALKVLNRTQHLPGFTVFIAAEMSFKPDKVRMLKKDWVTPNTFGILASSDEINEYTAAAKIFFTQHIMRATSDINPFIGMTPWLAQRGPFATAFSSGIGSLSQSGLVERWRKNMLNGKVMHIVKTRFKSMRDLENKLVDEESSQEQLLSRMASGSYKWEGSGRLYSRFMLVPDKSSTLVSVHSVPFEVMKLPFLACLVLISLSFGVLWAEYVTMRLKPKANRQPVKEIVKVCSTNTKLQYTK